MNLICLAERNSIYNDSPGDSIRVFILHIGKIIANMLFSKNRKGCIFKTAEIHDMSYEYTDLIIETMRKAEEKNHDALETLIREMMRTVEEDKLIHTFGTGHGHMIGMELFDRAGGLANVDCILDNAVLLSQGARRSSEIERVSGVSDIIFDTYHIEPGDIMIISSNSGRNAMPIEMAMRCRKEGIFTAAITNVKQSKKTVSRHASGKKLYECVDLVIDNCCPGGDALLEYDGIMTGPATSIVGMNLVNIAATETIKRCLEKGIRPYVFQSQNIDGYNNEEVIRKFLHRIRHI